MCGIAGILSTDPVDNSALGAMLHAIAHRGPDDEGWLLGTRGEGTHVGRGEVPSSPSNVALGHRRLSVLDLAPTAAQPMSSPDGRFALTYNGEIYNYRELRRELEASGWAFRSTGDTEVLLAAWAAWGPQALSRFTGMFALCLVDFTERRAYLARDPFGIKPLFVASLGATVVFASEVGALLASGAVAPVLDAAMAYDYLRFGRVDHGERTLVRGIRRLPSASYMEIDLTDVAVAQGHRYWQRPSAPLPISFGEAVDAVRSAFERSIELHLRSDVPIGMALSGGIDSSSIVAMARRVAGPDMDLHCFSYLADDPRVDESKWVDVIASATGALVHPVRADAGSLRSELPELIRSQGEPFGGTSIFAQRKVFEAARAAGVTVLLDGQGADELFGGYRSYLAARFVGLVRARRYAAAARVGWGVSRLPDVSLSPHVVLRAARSAVPPRLRRLLPAGARSVPFLPWMNEQWFKERGGEGNPTPVLSGLDDALSQAFTQTSLPALLRYEDHNSMWFSIESRVPFLERDFVELVSGLPSEWMVGPDATSKWVFREAMRGIVPDEILNRRDKIGFSTPEDQWLRGEAAWVRDVASSSVTAPWSDERALGKTVEEYLTNRPLDDHVLWRCLNLQLWQEAFGVAA